MGLEAVWKTLNDLVMEFRKRGEVVPSEVIADLRAAKTLLYVFKADPTRTENIPTIETYLGNVESHLIFAAQTKFGSKFVSHWMEKLREAREKSDLEVPAETASRFIPGLPRDKRWLRIQVSKQTSRKDLEKVARESGLNCRMQDDGFMLVYGDGEKLKFFVKKMAAKLRTAKE